MINIRSPLTQRQSKENTVRDYRYFTYVNNRLTFKNFKFANTSYDRMSRDELCCKTRASEEKSVKEQTYSLYTIELGVAASSLYQPENVRRVVGIDSSGKISSPVNNIESSVEEDWHFDSE